MPEVTELWAYVAADPDDPTDEGVIGAYNESTKEWFPLVGADRDRMLSYAPLAHQIKAQSGVILRLLRFDNLTDMTHEIPDLDPEDPDA